MNTAKYLPLGTIVLLKNGTRPVMIIGFEMVSNGQAVYKNGQMVSSEQHYDYCGCVYPEGVINSLYMLLFNHSDIDKILHNGYVTEEYKQYNEKLLNGTALQEFRIKESNIKEKE